MRTCQKRAGRRLGRRSRIPARSGALMLLAQLHLALPAWVHEIADRALYPGDDDKMSLAIMLAQRNVEARSGGPFGAAVFDDRGRLISIGVNRVLSQNITLATSAQPCVQCYGATFWAGIDRMLIGARREDVTRLTAFDEGPLPTDWVGQLERCGMEIVCDVQRDAACEVLRLYIDHDGEAY